MKKTRKDIADEQGVEINSFQDNIAWKLGRNTLQHQLATRHQKVNAILAFIIVSLIVAFTIHLYVNYQITSFQLTHPAYSYYAWSK